MVERRKKSWFEKMEKVHKCNHPEHNPPTQLWIPPDEIYHHICPACGEEKIIRGSGISFSV